VVNWLNSHLVCDPTIRQPGFDLPRQHLSLLNRFRMEQGHCGACRTKWRLTDTDLCPCGETQTMSCLTLSNPVPIKLNGGLSWLHSADTWRCCFVADQLWLMKCIREEEERSYGSTLSARDKRPDVKKRIYLLLNF